MEDCQIIDLYFDRSERAISATSEKYGGYLSVIARNILHSDQDTEECVNDTYLHAWNAIPPTRPTALRVWLGRVTRNLSLDRWKRARAQKRGGEETELLLEELELCVSAPHSTEKILEDQELASLISGFLRNLSQDNRVIFVRRYWYGDDLAQIAARLRCGEGKVKSSLFRTRNALRAFLEQQEVTL